MPLAPTLDIITQIDDVLDHGFPEKLFVVKEINGPRYLCWLHYGKHGLAVFSGPGNAQRMSLEFGIDLPNMAPEEVDFDEAYKIAQERPMPVTCMLLLDDPHNPRVYEVHSKRSKPD